MPASASVSVTIGDNEAEELRRDRVDGTLSEGLRVPGFTERDSIDGFDLIVDPFSAGAGAAAGGGPGAVVGVAAPSDVDVDGFCDNAFRLIGDLSISMDHFANHE